MSGLTRVRGHSRKKKKKKKRRLTSTSILIVPDRGQRYIMYCDASKDGLGCVLM